MLPIFEYTCEPLHWSSFVRYSLLEVETHGKEGMVQS